MAAVRNDKGSTRLNDDVPQDRDRPNLSERTGPGQRTVMERVELLAWCRARHCSLRQRLKLFIQLCRLVGADHRRGLVHGGIESGRVRVTDEGVVELLAARSDPAAPGYAPPEQLVGDELSTAADVYALGVLLYRLLSARKPIALGGLPAAQAIERAIRETPSPPSAAATPDAPVAPRLLRGDLDAIVLKCLCKDPRERYASAQELEAELRRFLAHRPVRVRGRARAYLMRRFLRRHRLITAATLLLTVVVCTVAMMLRG